MWATGGQLDVRHALTTNLGQGDFNAALLTDNTTVLQALVLTAQALVVLDWTKNLGAEQTVTLGFERTVVDGFRFLTSPNDHERIISGEANPIRMASNSST